MNFTATENFAKVPVASPSAITDNTNFKLSGASASCARDAAGGVKITTNAGSNAIGELLPYTGSAWDGTTWTSANSLRFKTTVRTAASIADILISVGLSDFPTDITAVTDDDLTQFDINFVFQSALSPNWLLVATTGSDNVPTIIDTGIVVEASTAYELGITIDSSFNVFMFINGLQAHYSQVAVFPSHTLQPYIGLRGNAKSLSVLNAEISQTA